MFHLNYFQDPRFGPDRIRLFKLLLAGLVLLAGAGLLLFLPQNPARNSAKPALPRKTTEEAVPSTDTANEKSPALPSDPEERIEKAILAYSAGDTGGAEKLLTGVDLRRHGSAGAWELAGLLKQAAGDRKAAGEFYTQGIALFPSEGLYYRRALLYREDEALSQALEDMNKAAAHSPDDVVISNERLLLLLQIGRKDLVEKELQQLNSRDAGSSPGAWIFAMCGVALENGEYDKAARLLGLAKKSVPPQIFGQLLKNPVLVRQQTRPEILPFYISNLPSQQGG